MGVPDVTSRAMRRLLAAGWGRLVAGACADNAGEVECSMFEDYVTPCPRVVRCERVRDPDQRLSLNACVNERGTLERVVACGSDRHENESGCTVASFLPCDRVVGDACTPGLAVCGRGRSELSIARCCEDAAECTVGRYVLLPRRSSLLPDAGR